MGTAWGWGTRCRLFLTSVWASLSGAALSVPATVWAGAMFRAVLCETASSQMAQQSLVSLQRCHGDRLPCAPRGAEELGSRPRVPGTCGAHRLGHGEGVRRPSLLTPTLPLVSVTGTSHFKSSGPAPCVK